MAPNRGPTSKSNSEHTLSKNGSKSRAPSSSNGTPAARKSKPTASRPPPRQVKTKGGQQNLKKKKKQRVYTDKELGLPALNMITPAGVQKPRGKKKGKVFVDDQESMMTILAMVNAEKEGQIESKMMKARQMEEIRDARRKEAETRQEDRKSKLEETKDSLRRKRKRKPEGMVALDEREEEQTPVSRNNRKRVSFA